MDVITTSLLCALVITFLAKHYLRKSQTLEKNRRLPPGPKPWTVVGNLPEMIVSGLPPYRWIQGLMKQFDTDIACIRLGNVHVIPVKSPEIAREFLRKHDSSFSSRPLTLTSSHSSNGYLTVAVVPQGEQWNKMKKLLSAHVLNPSKLPSLGLMRDQEADNLVRFVYKQCCNGANSINLRLVSRQYCGNVIRKMLFNTRYCKTSGIYRSDSTTKSSRLLVGYFGKGREDGGPGEEEVEHVESAFTVLAHVYAFSTSDYVPLMRGFDWDGYGKMVRECMRNIYKYQNPMIEERVRLWRDGKRSDAEDMLDLFILAKDTNGQPLSVDEIKAQCAELVLAVVDNPSNAVEWALAELINQPQLFRKVVDEINNVVGKERLVRESDLPNLHYVRACTREAFRLHPIAPFNLPHVSSEDTIVSGYFIPKGSHVLLSRYELGRNPRVWEDPLKYNPERHLKDAKAKVEIAEPDLKFISFSTGQRKCVGVALGSTMTYMLLARLVQGFLWDVPIGKDKIDLTQSNNDMFMNHPLHALAKPRLPATLYN